MMNVKYLIFLLVIVTVALLPREIVNFYGDLGISDPAVHVCSFVVISLVTIMNFHPSLFKSILSVLAVSFLSELLQGAMTSTRGFSSKDLISNITGMAIIFVPYLFYIFLCSIKHKINISENDLK